MPDTEWLANTPQRTKPWGACLAVDCDEPTQTSFCLAHEKLLTGELLAELRTAIADLDMVAYRATIEKCRFFILTWRASSQPTTSDRDRAK